VKDKLKIYDVGEKTPFSELTLYRKEKDQFWAKDTLRQVWVKDTIKSEESISRVDTLFGRVLSSSNKQEIKVTGQFYPLNLALTCEKAQLRLDSHQGTFDGYIIARPKTLEGLVRNGIYLLDYYLDEKMFIRGFYRMTHISTIEVAFDLIRQETLGDGLITVGWSDILN